MNCLGRDRREKWPYKPSTTERRNQGYWDGVAAKERGRWPIWAKLTVYRNRHPFDRIYGEGFWMGWYGDDAPNAIIR